jgi:hypothetical protein
MGIDKVILWCDECGLYVEIVEEKNEFNEIEIKCPEGHIIDGRINQEGD